MINSTFRIPLQILTLTREEAGREGEHLAIQYQIKDTLFGPICLASTTRGICTLFFVDAKNDAPTILRQQFPGAQLQEASNSLLTQAYSFFTGTESAHPVLPLHLQGTTFQLQVWKALLSIPPGSLATYGTIAAQIGRPTACRAVGSAIGANPIAYLIPCHRIIQASGHLGNYRWGAERKRKLIEWEAKTHPPVDQNKRTM